MATMPATPMLVAAVLLLLIPWVSTQVAQSASDGSPQLRFVAQLSVNGCALFVHDTGANDGPHLAVEPIMCVTERLRKVAPEYDSVTKHTYVSVPVMLRDDAMLAVVQRQLRHLSAKSVKFATVSDISVITDASSKFQDLGFDWTPEDPTGILRLGCENAADGICAKQFSSESRMSLGLGGILNYALLSVTVATSSGSISQLNYRPMLQNSSLSDPSINSLRYASMPSCQQLRFVRSIRLINCTARVHQRLDMEGHFLIEPLLCHNITSMTNEPIMYDYSREMCYLKLNVVLQDDMTVDAVRAQLADLSPRSVAFMRLWRAQSHVASALSRRFKIGPLMVSGDWRSAQLRVYCRTEGDCVDLKTAVTRVPAALWRQMKWRVTSLQVDTNKCFHESELNRLVSAFPLRDSTNQSSPVAPTKPDQIDARRRKMSFNDREFVVIQQRLTGNVSFQRSWAEYERGFGDNSDFWIGLSEIHSLSINGATLRVEMKLWDGTELHAEYAGFKVGDASTNYRMTYREMLRNRSSVSYDAMEHHRGMQFSTMDRDNDLWPGSTGSCSNRRGGKGGWWPSSCYTSNPNGLYDPTDVDDEKYSFWHTGSRRASLREVRLMLQI